MALNKMYKELNKRVLEIITELKGCTLFEKKVGLQAKLSAFNEVLDLLDEQMSKKWYVLYNGYIMYNVGDLRMPKRKDGLTDATRTSLGIHRETLKDLKSLPIAEFDDCVEDVIIKLINYFKKKGKL